MSIKSIELKKRSDLHLARKVWHLGGVLLISGLHIIIPREIAVVLLCLFAAFITGVDILRHRYRQLNELFVFVFRPVLRQSEVHRVSGISFLLLGILIILVLFSRPVVSLALLFLAFADPVASYFGIKFGKDKIWGEKSLQGFLAAFAVCTLLTLIFIARQGTIAPSRYMIISLIGGLIGGLSELIQIGKLDDNLTLPVFSATGLFFLFNLFGVF